MKKHKGLRLAAALLVLLLLAGCGAGSGAADNTAAAQGAVTEESYDAALTETGSDTAADRKLITTADLSLDVTDFDAATGEIERQVEELGGYLASSSKGGSAESANRWAEYQVRIPAQRLGAFLDSAGGTGTVISLTQGTTDVTSAYVDNEARLESLRTQEERLLELMAQAEKLEDLILLEDKLTEVRYEIESITGQQKLYDNQVAYATVSLYVNEVSRETITAPTFADRIAEAFYGSGRNFLQMLENGLILLIYMLPMLLVVLVIVAVVLLSVRAGRRRRAKRTPPPPPPPQAGV